MGQLVWRLNVPRSKLYQLNVLAITYLRKHRVKGNENKKKVISEFKFRQKSGKFGISKFVESENGKRMRQRSTGQLTRFGKSLL